MRENKGTHVQKKSMVLQERLYFRNIPLSNWIETEMLVEQTGEEPRLPSSFNTRGLGVEGQGSMSRLLESIGGGREMFVPAGD
jgi:hypothetical protein